MLKNVELAFFFAVILMFFLCLRLSAGKGRYSHLWLLMPFALVFGYAANQYAYGNLSLDYLLWTGYVCGVFVLFLSWLCGLVNSLGILEIDPSKPLALPPRK